VERGGGSLFTDRYQHPCRKTGAGAPLREAPKPTIITEDWVKCALKSICVPYGAPASEKKRERASETPTRSINLRSLSPRKFALSRCGEYGVCARILTKQQRAIPGSLMTVGHLIGVLLLQIDFVPSTKAGSYDFPSQFQDY
jgi:hypothetical protein